MEIVILTTSYPRDGSDVAGTFVCEGVEALRSAGDHVTVVSPASFRHYGIAYGDGILNNLRRRPWLAVALPLFFLSYARVARRAAKSADIVHAHWLPSAIPALATGRPFVLQLWGSDVALVRRARWCARPLVSRAGLIVVASTSLADEALSLGAHDVRLIPSAVAVPESVGTPGDPPHVLYVGRLSEEKGVRELAEAARGLPLVVVGDGPLRSLHPDTAGFVPPSELGPYYERAAVVVVPSRREGYGMVARQAMAYGRAVVATAVGGLTDAVQDGVNGLLVPPHDAARLREALVRLLEDAQLRAQLGANAREYVAEQLTPAAFATNLRGAYEDVLGAMGDDEMSR
jgi:glycosyltransferase involved in cell wall biosynthesis